MDNSSIAMDIVSGLEHARSALGDLSASSEAGLAASAMRDRVLEVARSSLADPTLVDDPALQRMAGELFGEHGPGLTEMLRSPAMSTSFKGLTARDINEMLDKGYSPAELKLAFDKAHNLVVTKGAPDQEIQEIHDPCRMLLGIMEGGFEIPFKGRPVVTGFVNDNGLSTPRIEWSTDAPETDEPFHFSIGDATRPDPDQVFSDPSQMNQAFEFLKESVPHGNVNDGCDDRCTYTAAMLQKVMGYKVGKIKIRTTGGQNFRQTSPFPPSRPDGPRAKDASWKMHTATVVYMEEGGEVTPYVLDVALPQAIPLEDWKKGLTAGLTDAEFEEYMADQWDTDLSSESHDVSLKLSNTTKILQGMNLHEVVNNNDFSVRTEGGAEWVLDGLLAAGMQLIDGAPLTKIPVITNFDPSGTPEINLYEPDQIRGLEPHKVVQAPKPLLILDAAFDSLGKKKERIYFVETVTDASTHQPLPRLLGRVRGLLPGW